MGDKNYFDRLSKWRHLWREIWLVMEEFFFAEETTFDSVVMEEFLELVMKKITNNDPKIHTTTSFFYNFLVFEVFEEAETTFSE